MTLDEGGTIIPYSKVLHYRGKKSKALQYKGNRLWFIGAWSPYATEKALHVINDSCTNDVAVKKTNKKNAVDMTL